MFSKRSSGRDPDAGILTEILPKILQDPDTMLLACLIVPNGQQIEALENAFIHDGNSAALSKDNWCLGTCVEPSTKPLHATLMWNSGTFTWNSYFLGPWCKPLLGSLLGTFSNLKLYTWSPRGSLIGCTVTWNLGTFQTLLLKNSLPGPLLGTLPWNLELSWNLYLEPLLQNLGIFRTFAGTGNS